MITPVDQAFSLEQTPAPVGQNATMQRALNQIENESLSW
jgi:hypothetical protein